MKPDAICRIVEFYDTARVNVTITFTDNEAGRRALHVLSKYEGFSYAARQIAKNIVSTGRWGADHNRRFNVKIAYNMWQAACKYSDGIESIVWEGENRLRSFVSKKESKRDLAIEKVLAECLEVFNENEFQGYGFELNYVVDREHSLPRVNFYFTLSEYLTREISLDGWSGGIFLDELLMNTYSVKNFRLLMRTIVLSFLKY